MDLSRAKNAGMMATGSEKKRRNDPAMVAKG
jgi:hypothetical protein